MDILTIKITTGISLSIRRRTMEDDIEIKLHSKCEHCNQSNFDYHVNFHKESDGIFLMEEEVHCLGCNTFYQRSTRFINK